jgi:hypothetical protein
MVSIVQVAAIILLFILVGPPLGGVFGVMLATLSTISSGSSPKFGDFLMGLIMGPLLSYIIGAVPAAVAGLTIGIKQVYFAGAGWRFALGVGALVGIALVIYVGKPDAGKPWPGAGYWLAGGGYLVATTFATLICWSIVKSWFLDWSVGSGVRT